MEPPEADRTFINFSNLVVLILVALTVAMALASPGFAPFSFHALLFYGMMAFFAAAGVYVDSHVLGRVPPPVEWLYFALQLGFYGALIGLKMPHSAIWLLTMPVISQASVRLPWPAVSVYAVLFLGLNCWLPSNPGWDSADRWRTALSLASAYVFVVAMTMVVEAARKARARAETLAKELEQANAQLRGAAAQAAELAAATERNRIARDIHDGLGHYLTVVAVQLQAAQALLPGQSERVGESLAKAEQSARAALDAVRRSVGTLRENAGRPTLRTAIEGLVQEGGAAVAFDCTGRAVTLPEGAEQALFRTVQEALTNVRKHAGPARVSVVLDYGAPGVAAVEIVDDGRGVASPAATGGFGLAGLRERLAAVGGTLQSGAGERGGFRVRAEVPV